MALILHLSLSRILFLGVSIAIATILFFYYASLYNQAPLIPKDILFGNPIKVKPILSPDGKKIAYVAPYNKVLNLWVASIENDHIDYEKEPITYDVKSGVRNCFWSHDGKSLFYTQDKDGDENSLLYQVDIASKEVTLLTPFKEVKVGLIDYDHHFPNKMLLAINATDARYHDVYELDVPTKKLTLIEKNPGTIVGWIPHNNFKIGAVLTIDEDGGYDLLVRKDTAAAWKKIRSWSVDDVSGLDILGFAADNITLYLRDSKDSNTNRVCSLNSETGVLTVLLQDPEYDTDADILLDHETHEIQAIATTRERLSWTILDPSLKEDFKHIEALDHGDFSITSKDLSQNLFTVHFEKDNGPIAYWLYNRLTKKGQFLFYNKPSFNKYKLAATEPVNFAARDGLIIHGYVTYPVGIKRKNLPLVLNVHGGPWARDTWGYNPEVQWLANRGYAVLQINYRGSTGYGKIFHNAGNREWAGKMHTDLLDGLAYIESQGTINPKKIGIYGGSYGGYAALVGATFTPDIFACAVDIVGPSNIVSLIHSTPPYWANALKQFYQRVGHPEIDKEFLESCSPLFKVDAIKIPLLIAQGANDPRVKQSEAEQIVAALKAKNIPHTYMLFSDEGHGFVKPANRIKFYTEAEKFLAEHLGGRQEK